MYPNMIYMIFELLYWSSGLVKCCRKSAFHLQIVSYGKCLGKAGNDGVLGKVFLPFFRAALLNLGPESFLSLFLCH